MMLTNEYPWCVYIHYRNDNNTIFYVGKGKGKRPWETGKSRRGIHWQNVYRKVGRTVQIIARFRTNKESKEHEKFIISCLRDIGIKLVNKTGGGDGFGDGDDNPMRNPVVAKKVGDATRGKKRAEGKNRGGVKKGTTPWNAGKELTAEQSGWDNAQRRKEASERGKKLTGENNPMYGKVAYNRGVAPTQQTLDKLRSSVAKVPKITCQCGAVMKKAHLARWHWDENGICRRREPLDKP